MSNQTPIDAGQPMQGEIMEVPTGVNGISGVVRAEIDIQIATARRYPRSETVAIQKAESLATLDIETAASCFYKLPRGNKLIEGPGIRLAELFAACWGNIRYGARIVSIEEKLIHAQGFAIDLQNNTAFTAEVPRRITDRNGKRYNDDMIAVTGNAACAIAARNALFKVIPSVFIRRVYERCKVVAVGDAKTLEMRRAAQLEFLQAKVGVPLANILYAVGKTAVGDIGLPEMETLYGLATAIRDGQTDVDSAFPPPPGEKSSEPTDPGKSATDKLADKIKSAPPESGEKQGSTPISDQKTAATGSTPPNSAPPGASEATGTNLSDAPAPTSETPTEPANAGGANAGGGETVDKSTGEVKSDDVSTLPKFTEAMKAAGADDALIGKLKMNYPIGTDRATCIAKRMTILDAFKKGLIDPATGKMPE